MIVTENMKIVCAVTILALAAGVAYTYVPHKSVNVEETVESLSVVGEVIRVEPDKLEVTIESTSGTKIVEISPATKIEKIISQKNTSGAIERQITTEVNISEVQIGDVVAVVYNAERNTMLVSVDTVTFVSDGNVDEYLKSQMENQDTYLRGEVVSVDLTEKNIIYKPYLPGTVELPPASVTVSNGVPIYRMDDPLRAPILHARVTTKLENVNAGNPIVLMVDNKALKDGKIVLKAVIVAGI